MKKLFLKDVLVKRDSDVRNFLPNDFLRLNVDLFTRKRKDKVLVVEPETASWIVLKEKEYELLKKFKKPIRYSQIVKIMKEKNEREIKLFLNSIYKQQILSINGSFYYRRDIHRQKDNLPGYYCIRVTDRCNFRCRYCYTNSDITGKDMELRTLKIIIKKIITDNPRQILMIEFHG